MQVGSRLGHEWGYDGYGNAPRSRGSNVDIGRRDFHRCNRAQLRVGGDHVGVDAIRQKAEQDIVLAHRGEKLVLGHGVERIEIPIHLGHAAQALDRAACYGLRDEDA